MTTLDGDALDRQLADGLLRLGLDAGSGQRRRWIGHVALLRDWNRAYNLTATRKPADIVSSHVLDSLSIAPHLRGRRILDIGTGAGFPGIPLAVLFPDREFHLLDSNGKKIRFLFQVKQSLALDNVVLHQVRAEAFRDDPGFDCIVSRAFASLADMLQVSAQLCHPAGCFLAMKGELRAGEENSVPAPYTVSEIVPLRVPGVAGIRQLLRIVRSVTRDQAAVSSYS